jgi:hypothetical protein
LRLSRSSGPSTAAAASPRQRRHANHRHLPRQGQSSNLSVRRPARRSEVRATARILAIWLAQNWPSGRRGPRAGYHNRVGVDQPGEARRGLGLDMTGGGFARQTVRLCPRRRRLARWSSEGSLVLRGG